MDLRPPLTALAALAVAVPAVAQGIDVHADTDRDGRVERVLPTSATTTIVLPNLDDDSGRCPKVREGKKQGTLTFTDGRPAPVRAVVGCNDAMDAVSNGPEDIKDLTPIRVMPSSVSSAGGPVEVTLDGAPRGAMRVLVRRGATYRDVRTSPLTPADLSRGVMLGVEATDVVRDHRRWNGRATLRIAHGRHASAPVRLQVAPMLYQNDLGRVTHLFTGGTAPYPDDSPAGLEVAAAARRYARDTSAAAASVGASHVKLYSRPGDVWVQDAFEPALVTRPTPSGPHGLHLLVRAVMPGRDVPLGSHLTLYNQVRGRDVGIVTTQGSQGAAAGTSGASSGGNWSVLPPHRTARANYPQGRIIYGGTPDRRLVEMARAQGMQAPLALDVSWLSVGHLDETVTILPSRNKRGWVVGVGDARGGLELLRRAQAQAGPGTTLLTGLTRADIGPEPFSEQRTVAQMLADPDVIEGTRLAGEGADKQIALLKRVVGLSDDEIVRLPVLVHRAPDGKVVTDVPNVVNSQHLGGGLLLSPHQYGPKVNGVDLFEDAVTRLVKPHGVTVRWIDDFHHAHLSGGEVHCTTNVLRRASREQSRWWETVTARPGT